MTQYIFPISPFTNTGKRTYIDCSIYNWVTDLCETRDLIFFLVECSPPGFDYVKH